MTKIPEPAESEIEKLPKINSISSREAFYDNFSSIKSFVYKDKINEKINDPKTTLNYEDGIDSISKKRAKRNDLTNVNKHHKIKQDNEDL